MGSLLVPMGLYGVYESLWVSMALYWSLWGLYESLWVPMGPYGSQWVLMWRAEGRGQRSEVRGQRSSRCLCWQEAVRRSQVPPSQWLRAAEALLEAGPQSGESQ